MPYYYSCLSMLRTAIWWLRVLSLAVGTFFAVFGFRWFVIFHDDFRQTIEGLPVAALQSPIPQLPLTNVADPWGTGQRDVAKVAYILSITNCQPGFAKNLYDAAAVWKHSIQLHSHPRSSKSKYEPHFYAIVPPSLQNSTCAQILTTSSSSSQSVPKEMDLSMTLLVRDYPATPSQIREGTFLQRKIKADGCCGHRELLKLHTYTMTEYDVAVHLDLDTLLVSPLDELLDAMHYPSTHPVGRAARNHLVDAQLIAPTYRIRSPLVDVPNIAAFYTRDYNMLPKHKEKRAGMQGGFLLVRPNQTVFDELVSLVKDGNYTQGRKARSGWKNSGFGQHIWGSLTIQGLLGYYYWTPQQNARSIELHRCKFNQVADNPRRSTYHQTYPRGTPFEHADVAYHDVECKDGRDDCDDVQCQIWPIEDTRLVHFTTCKVPWSCRSLRYNETWNMIGCRSMYKAWYETRRSLESELRARFGDVVSAHDGGFEPEHHMGYCSAKGGDGYIPMVSWNGQIQEHGRGH